MDEQQLRLAKDSWGSYNGDPLISQAAISVLIQLGVEAIEAQELLEEEDAESRVMVFRHNMLKTLCAHQQYDAAIELAHAMQAAQEDEHFQQYFFYSLIGFFIAAGEVERILTEIQNSSLRIAIKASLLVSLAIDSRRLQDRESAIAMLLMQERMCRGTSGGLPEADACILSGHYIALWARFKLPEDRTQATRFARASGDHQLQTQCMIAKMTGDADEYLACFNMANLVPQQITRDPLIVDLARDVATAYARTRDRSLGTALQDHLNAALSEEAYQAILSGVSHPIRAIIEREVQKLLRKLLSS